MTKETETTPAEVAQPTTQPAGAGATDLDAVNSRIAALCDQMAGQLPEHLKALVPAGLSPLDRLEWLQKAKAAPAPVVVPTTDTTPPRTTPRTVDLSTLSASARMAAGYITK
jgi:hypothetical protein